MVEDFDVSMVESSELLESRMELDFFSQFTSCVHVRRTGMVRDCGNDNPNGGLLPSIVMDRGEVVSDDIFDEQILALYLLADSLVMMKNKWEKKIARREAWEFFFDNEWEESLIFWCDVADVDVEVMRNIAVRYRVNEVGFSNHMRHWRDV